MSRLAAWREEAAAVLASVAATPPAPRLGMWTPEALARRIDHTLLKPEASRADIQRVADEGAELGTASVCVNGSWVPLVASRLAGTSVLTCAVVGFPLGAMATAAKAAEASRAVADGAAEVDMVMALGLAKADEWEGVLDDVQAVVAAAAGARVKVILETAALTAEQVALASLVCRDAGAAFVKTSTGFHPAGGASVEAVVIMARAVNRQLGVKASGGIRSRADAFRYLTAGATRLGASSTRAILVDDAPMPASGY